MRTNNPEILKIIADRNRRIVELAEADANRTIQEIADAAHCSKDTVAVIFRRNGINRKVGGYRPKAVSHAQ
jgi:DNA-binding Lrp family transcriptional regulator